MAAIGRDERWIFACRSDQEMCRAAVPANDVHVHDNRMDEVVNATSLKLGRCDEFHDGIKLIRRYFDGEALTSQAGNGCNATVILTGVGSCGVDGVSPLRTMATPAVPAIVARNMIRARVQSNVIESFSPATCNPQGIHPGFSNCSWAGKLCFRFPGLES